MRVATLQIASPDTEPMTQRIARVDAQIRDQEALTSCDLLVLPELWGVGCFHFDAYADAAEPFDGPSVHVARSWAMRHELYVHLGSFVERDGESLFNTAALLSPQGDVVVRYRKVHLFGRDEARIMTPGQALAVAPLADLNLGLATCYDLRFPELFRSIIDAGATATAVAAAWPAARAEHWRLFTITRAVEEQMYVVACNAVGTQNGTGFAGGSLLVDPWGTVVAEADDQEGFLYADIDASMPTRVRQGFPALADRRWLS